MTKTGEANNNNNILAIQGIYSLLTQYPAQPNIDIIIKRTKDDT